MKTTHIDHMDIAGVALWGGLLVGLGLAFHRLFFVLAAIIAIGVPFARIVESARGPHAPAR